MNSPEFWGWSTAPLSIFFWGWEDAGSLKGRLVRAPRVVHSACRAARASENAAECKHSTVASEAKSVRACCAGVIIAGADKAPGISVVHATGRASNCSFIPKAQGRDHVDKAVKEKASAPTVEKPPVESVIVAAKSGAPNISS